jgi:hypothetical protein
MDKVQKNTITDYNAPLSEPFGLHSNLLAFVSFGIEKCEYVRD